MNQVDAEKKTALMKLLAIIGLLAVLIFGAWVAVRIVVLLPAAFSSLASLADGVYTYNSELDPISIKLNETVVASGELSTISWTETNQPGSYYFVHECVDGVAVSTIIGDEETPILCDDLLPVEGYELTVRIESEKDRFSDIPIEVLFVSDNAVEISATAVVTTVNASIADADIPEITLTPDPDSDDEVTNTTAEEEPEVTVTTPPTPPETPAIIPEFEYITQIPVSDPNGYTDLAIRYLGVGVIENDQFVFAPIIDNDKMGAIQFEVKNIGTKTSKEWTFAVELPNGVGYNSNDQIALKPNERAILTVGFGASDVKGNKEFSAEIETNSDLDSSNNKFEWVVEIVE